MTSIVCTGPAKLFWEKHLVKNWLISTLDKELFCKGLQNLSSLHKTGWRSAEKIVPFSKHVSSCIAPRISMTGSHFFQKNALLKIKSCCRRQIRKYVLSTLGTYVVCTCCIRYTPKYVPYLNMYNTLFKLLHRLKIGISIASDKKTSESHKKI
jgi:hypothetical protein